MGYKEVMQNVSKEQAIIFITNLKTYWSQNNGRDFDNLARRALLDIGISASVNGNTINAIVERMERKAKINF